MKTLIALIATLAVTTLSAQQPAETLADMEVLKTRLRVSLQRMTLDGALCRAANLTEKQGREVVVKTTDPFASSDLAAVILVEGMIAPKPGKEENITVYTVTGGKLPLYATSAALALHMRAGKRRPVTLALIEQCAFEAQLSGVSATAKGVTAQVSPRVDSGSKHYYDWLDSSEKIIAGKSASTLVAQKGDIIRKLYPASSAMASPPVFALSAVEALEIVNGKP
jgi:hypothetical protein